MNVAYSFILTLMHSMWQSLALLILYYVCSGIFLKKWHPLQKRNTLFGLIFIQLLLSIFTFCVLQFYKNTSIIFPIISTLFSSTHYTIVFLQKNSSIIISIYFLLIVAKSSKIFFQYYKLKQKISTQLIKPTAALKAFTLLKVYQFGIKQKVSIWFSKNIHTPITIGTLKPLILLPFSLLTHFSPTQIETIILHELTHIKNKDYFLNWLIICVETMYFFNPFIHIIHALIKLEREKNCDIQVLYFNYNSIQYAQTLLQLAKQKNKHQLFQIGIINKQSDLFKRIKFFSAHEDVIFLNKKLNFLASILFITTIFIATITVLNVNKVEKNKNINAAVVAKANPVQKSYLANKIAKNISKPKQAKQNIKSVLNKTAKTKTNNTTPEIDTVGFASFASYNQTPDSIKQLTYKYETKQGNITQVYKLTLINGVWLPVLQWQLVEKNADSLRIQEQ